LAEGSVDNHEVRILLAEVNKSNHGATRLVESKRRLAAPMHMSVCVAGRRSSREEKGGGRGGMCVCVCVCVCEGKKKKER